MAGGGLKAIKRRLVSIKNTRQITRAMKLVSAAKLNRAQEAVMRSREYSNTLAEVMRNLLREIDPADVTHPLMQSRPEVKKVAIVVLGGSRGLCGAYNTNINKTVEALLKEFKAKGQRVESILVGRKPSEYYRRMKHEYIIAHENLLEDPNQWPLKEISELVQNDFISGKVDEVYMIYTEFKSVMSQKVKVERILPFALDESENVATESNEVVAGVTIFEPSKKDVFSTIIPRLMRMKIQQAALETKASEHASRMTAMDSATKNAGELNEKLQLLHNRLRQSRITSELLDIVGGAEAVS
jgi:F-type H+-transporting ATPase subunit gamma